jgi:hypothetical protein
VLTANELAHYQEHGYVIPSFRLPPALLAPLREGVDRVLASYTDVPPEDLANPHMLPSVGDGAGATPNPFMQAAR